MASLGLFKETSIEKRVKSCVERSIYLTGRLLSLTVNSSLQKLSSHDLACLSLVLNNVIINIDSIGFLNVDLGF